uniref:Uncharacterized protein n=1 Tax=Anguilla anguilla TaxID=7936 RepID=A0A0E9WDF3_ANGAN
MRIIVCATYRVGLTFSPQEYEPIFSGIITAK